MANAPYDPTQDPSRKLSPDEILRNIGPDATATFDNSASNPTAHAGSEATNASTAVAGDGDDLEDQQLEDEDDDAALEQAEDEESEGEDVEDQAYINSRGSNR